MKADEVQLKVSVDNWGKLVKRLHCLSETCRKRGTNSSLARGSVGTSIVDCHPRAGKYRFNTWGGISENH